MSAVKWHFATIESCCRTVLLDVFASVAMFSGFTPGNAKFFSVSKLTSIRKLNFLIRIGGNNAFVTSTNLIVPENSSIAEVEKKEPSIHLKQSPEIRLCLWNLRISLLITETAYFLKKHG